MYTAFYTSTFLRWLKIDGSWESLTSITDPLALECQVCTLLPLGRHSNSHRLVPSSGCIRAHRGHLLGCSMQSRSPLWVQCGCSLAWPGSPTSHSLPLVHSWTRPTSHSAPGPHLGLPHFTLCPWSTAGLLPTSHSLPLVHTWALPTSHSAPGPHLGSSPLHTLYPWSTPGPLSTSHSLPLVHTWASCWPKIEAFFDPEHRSGPFGPCLLFNSYLWGSPTSDHDPHGHVPYLSSTCHLTQSFKTMNVQYPSIITLDEETVIKMLQRQFLTSSRHHPLMRGKRQKHCPGCKGEDGVLGSKAGKAISSKLPCVTQCVPRATLLPGSVTNPAASPFRGSSRSHLQIEKRRHKVKPFTQKQSSKV